MGLIGPNGCGKTTLVRCLSGSLDPRKGKVEILGKSLVKWKQRDLARKMAIVPQDASSAFDFTVSEVVSMGRYPHMGRFSLHDPGGGEAIQRSLMITELVDLAGKKMSQLSGGERQRVYIARAFAQETDILIMDEPNKNLDIKHSLELMKIVKERNMKEGITVVCVLHDIDMAARFCDTVVLIKDGRIGNHGPVRKVLTERWIEETFDINVKVHRGETFHIEVLG